MDNATGRLDGARKVRPRSARSLAAEAAFRARLAELGAVPLYEEYHGAMRGHHARCAAGHDCYPRPSGLQQGEGPCRVCAGNDPAHAEAQFRQRLEELGAVPLFEKWLGSSVRHHVLCAAGHDCYPTPGNVRSGWGFCKRCAGKSPDVAEAEFRERLLKLGATPLYEKYLGNKRPHHVRCVAGHECWPSPGSVRAGRGICKICARRDPATAEAEFRARVSELGGTPLYKKWLGSIDKHHVRCAAGHDAYPRPNDVQQGIGICVACAGLDPAVAEAKFRARLQELGAVPLYEGYLGTGRRHHVRCANGHDCYPFPGNVNGGQGICATCAGQEWDAFYVVTGGGIVKFGITSGDPRPRLRVHAAQGYREVVRLVTGLPGTVALDAENAVKSALALAGEKPARGREYFDVSCLALIVDVADSWLAIADAPTELRAAAEIASEWVQEVLFAA